MASLEGSPFLLHGFAFICLWLACSLGPLLTEANGLHLITFLGYDNMALSRVSRRSLGLVVALYAGSLKPWILLLAHHFVFFFLAVLAAARKSAAEGAPLLPGDLILSSLPALIRRLLAAILA